MKTPVLSCENLSFAFPDNPDATILNNVNISLFPGELHLLLGDNGAGKTSLVKLLSGVIPHGTYKGMILKNSAQVRLHIPKDALLLDIVTIHQDPCLYEDLTVAENLYANIPHTGKRSFLSKNRLIKMASAFFAEHGIELDPAMPVEKLNIQLKRKLELVRLYLREPEVLILDEPVSTISEYDMDFFLDLLRYFKEKGTAILCISHNYMPFYDQIDRFSILNGKGEINSYEMGNYGEGQIAELVMLDFCKERYPKIHIEIGPEVFCAEHISIPGGCSDISFSLHKGEVLGIFGRAGSGKDILSKSLFGLAPISEGSLYVDRLPARITSPSDAIELGIAYVTEDRNEYGLFRNLASLENIYSIKGNSLERFWAHTRHEYNRYYKYSDKLNFPVSPHQIPDHLSGGQQQKLILMRWLLSTAKIFIFNEPTQSIDIPSKIDIYNMFNNLIMKGASIILFSSNLEELMGTCDRIIYISGGKVSGETKGNLMFNYE